jgi:hypothetical protein
MQGHDDDEDDDEDDYEDQGTAGSSCPFDRPSCSS